MPKDVIDNESVKPYGKLHGFRMVILTVQKMFTKMHGAWDWTNDCLRSCLNPALWSFYLWVHDNKEIYSDRSYPSCLTCPEKPPWKHLHSHSQRWVSWVIVGPVKSTVKVDHTHRVTNNGSLFLTAWEAGNQRARRQHGRSMARPLPGWEPSTPCCIAAQGTCTHPGLLL